MKSFLSLPFLVLAVTVSCYSQQPADTLRSQSDSLYIAPIDTTKKTTADTTRKSDIDAEIDYSAKDSAVFDIANEKLELYNEGDIKYKEFELQASRIILFKQSATLDSYGVPDSAKAGKFIGTPVFFESGKKYEGQRVKYNFITRQGNITMGATELEGGYYLGEKIKKVAEDVYFIQNGSYTTCDKKDPDYYFGSPKMKVIQGDKVIAEPVYLYVADVPIFAIPFGIFPNHSGRSSGIIAPAYGEDATYGRYLAHLGYFWATNDFMDAALQGNYFTKGRIDLTGRFRYALRYNFNGSLELGGTRIRLGEATDVDHQFSDEWHIGLTHSQTIDPWTSLTANVNILSSKYYYNNSSNNLGDLLLQDAISNITLSRSWEGTPNSISINYSRDQNLQTGEINETVPSVTFTMSQSNPFRNKNTSLLDLKWYELISYSYSAQFLDIHTKTLSTDLLNSGSFIKDAHAGLKQALSISAPIKVSEFNVSPFFNYNEIWYNKYIQRYYDSMDSTVVTDELKGFKTMRYFSSGISLNTRIIGVFNTKFLGVQGFRHTVTPSVSYSYTPDFSKPQWNYYNSYIDASGNRVPYSLFEREVFGSAPVGESQSINFALGNVFEMKTKATDTSSNKFQLLNVNAAVGYNFAADSLKLSELTLGYRTEVASLLSVGGSTSFNFYKYVDNVGRINQYLWNTDKKIAQLTSFNINLSTTLAGSKVSTEKTDTTKNKTQKSEDEYIGIYGDRPPDFSIPWSLMLNYNYGMNKEIPTLISKSSNISANFSFSLTKNWKFTFTAGYDIFLHQVTAPYITIYRDLHCWEMNFNWIPVGLYRGFRFELRIKAPQLQDVKVTKETNYRGVY